MWFRGFLLALAFVFQDATTARGQDINARLNGWTDEGPQFPQKESDAAKTVAEESRVVRFGRGAADSRNHELLLMDGSRIVATIAEVNEREVVLGDNACQVKNVPMEWVLGIDLASYALLPERMKFGVVARSCVGTEDHVIRIRGESVQGRWNTAIDHGTIYQPSQSHLRIQRGDETMEVPMNVIRGLVPSPALRSPLSQPGRFRIVLDDGCDLIMESINAKGAGRLACGLEIQVIKEETNRESGWWRRVIGWVDLGKPLWIGSRDVEGFAQQNLIGGSVKGNLHDVGDWLAQEAVCGSHYVGANWPALQGIVMPVRAQAAFRCPPNAIQLQGSVSVIETQAMRERSVSAGIRFRILVGPSLRELQEQWASPVRSATDALLPFAVSLPQTPGMRSVVVIAVEAKDAAGVAAMGVWHDLRYEESVLQP